MGKAREFWFKALNRLQEHEGHNRYMEPVEHPIELSENDRGWVTKVVHVVEYSAYEKACAALRQIERMDFELAGAIKISSDTLKELGELD